MLTVPSGIRVLVATRPVDFRKGCDGLAALVREALGQDPFSGTIFVFRSKRADRLKLLAWDGSGLVLFWKPLEHGAFRWHRGYAYFGKGHVDCRIDVGADALTRQVDDGIDPAIGRDQSRTTLVFG